MATMTGHRRVDRIFRKASSNVERSTMTRRLFEAIRDSRLMQVKM